jgi:3-oxoadipate enol-lactonase
VTLTAASDGCRIANRFDGRDDAPVVVLSHSLGTSMDLWRLQADALGNHFRLLRYDARGHGGSDAPSGDYTIERLGRDVIDLLDAHGIGRAHVCGISMGGLIAQWLGANAPERLDRLVVANTARYLGPPSNWDNRISLVRRDGVAALIDTLVERWFTPAFRRERPADVEAIRRIVLATPPDGYIGCCAALRDVDLRESSADIAAPTLLIAGSQDETSPPSELEAMADAMRPRPRIVTLAAAHLSNVEQADAFSAAVLEFLQAA